MCSSMCPRLGPHGFSFLQTEHFWEAPTSSVSGATLATKTSERSSTRPTLPISKTRYQPHQTISHAHHYLYPKIAPGEERIALVVPMSYAVHMCHM